MNSKGISNTVVLLVVIIALVIIFYKKVTGFELEDVPPIYPIAFFFVVVPFITFLYIWYIKASK